MAIVQVSHFSNRDGYLSATARAAETACEGGAAIVALAQASLAGAADPIRSGAAVVEPAAAFQAAINANADRRYHLIRLMICGI